MASASSALSRLRADPAVARCAPFGVFIGFLMVGSALAEPSPWLLVIRNACVLGVLAWAWPAYTELREAQPRAAWPWVAAVLAGVAVFGLWIVLDGEWAMFSRSGGFAPLHQDGRMDWPLALARLAGFALVVPVMEELFWRSFLLRWLEAHDFENVRPARIGLRAIAITAVLFALEHNQWLAAAIAGIAYSLLYVRYGSLWIAIAAHATTNAVLGGWILATGNWQFW